MGGREGGREGGEGEGRDEGERRDEERRCNPIKMFTPGKNGITLRST